MVDRCREDFDKYTHKGRLIVDPYQMWQAAYRSGEEWISVNDRLPAFGEPVLLWQVADGFGVHAIDYLVKMKNGSEMWDFFDMSEVTHWMPLPVPPKGDIAKSR